MCNKRAGKRAAGGRVEASAHVAKARVSPNGEAVGCIWVCIHMQIPIDMTTFTYCIFALGHILARQFPIVGFRPPVRLIDIIGRAADTRLHFYLHTFADQFEPTPLVRRSCCGPFLSSRFPDINDWTAIFVPARRALRAVICVSYFRERKCTRGAGATSIDTGDLAGIARGSRICLVMVQFITLLYIYTIS